jgi:hypothetical protein
MHPFIGISLLRLCAPGPVARERRAIAQAVSRREEARIRWAAARGVPVHLRRDVGLEG